MADSQKHLDQWKHNRQFARTIPSQYRDWQITVVFYTALHLIDAALAQLNVQVADHSDRNEQVKRNQAFSAVRIHYMDLYRISPITRYDADPDRWLPAKYLTVNDLVENLLRPIENGLQPLLKSVRFQSMDLKD